MFVREVHDLSEGSVLQGFWIFLFLGDKTLPAAPKAICKSHTK